MKLTPADKQKLVALLNELAGAVEDLLLTGLTTATEGTRKVLSVTAQEASRIGLMRLAGTLRVANEELGRFISNSPDFSSKRLTFFLNRSWLLTQAILSALKTGQDEQLDRVMRTPPNFSVEQLDVVTLGVAKRVTSAFCAFEFRLRAVSDSPKVPKGQRLMWSIVFPVKPVENEKDRVLAEAHLQIPQKQKFRPLVFLEKKVVRLENVSVALDEGGGRITLGETSTVNACEVFTEWEQFTSNDFKTALERIRAHSPGPFDLDVEMQEEIVVRDWSIGEPQKPKSDHGPTVFPITTDLFSLMAHVMPSPDGTPTELHSYLLAQKGKKKKSPLFGVMHYDKCSLIFQALSALEKEGPEQLMLSKETQDRRAILKTIDFTS